MDLILVVLYKQKVCESNTLRTLLNCKEILSDKILYVWDNSPSPLDTDELLFLENQFKNVKYFNSQDNKSLSEVYNTVIKQIQFTKIFVFDQDTTLDEKYFQKMDQCAFNNTDIGLFLPVVRNNNRIVSPLTYKIINFNRYENLSEGAILAKNKTAFASGLCIKEWVFKKNNIWFDQNLSFYGIDYKFVLDYGDFNKYLYVINYELKHSLSFNEKETKEIKIKRFDSNIAASFYLAGMRLNFFQKVIIFLRSFVTASKLSFKYKDTCFYVKIFENFYNLNL